MIINKQQMDELNAVQYDIFKAFHAVCEKLNLKYYLVHGSLLGALRYQSFFPMDDDIDVAMLRKDYDIFMSKGQKYIGDQYFVQSNLSEEDYPLPFGKVRANNTAFIQPVLDKCKVHKGIYIDVFPIDNYPTDKRVRKCLSVWGTILARRVNSKLNYNKRLSLKNKISRVVCRIIMPSWSKTRDMFCNIYSRITPTGKVIVRGGKTIEVGIPFELFGKPAKMKFGDIDSFAPAQTDEYLRLIYGDYMNYEPMGKYMVSTNEVNISAEIVDVNNSYQIYANIK